MDIKVKDSGGFDLPPKVEKKNNEMRAYYINYLEMGDGLGQKINELVLAIHEVNPDWSLNKIAQYICIINQDMDRFSLSNVKKNVTEENRVLLDVKTPKRVKALPNQLLEELRQQKGTQVTPSEEDVVETTAELLQNNVTEEKLSKPVTTLVPEQSSRTNDVEEVEEGEQEIIYDDPGKQIREYEQQIRDLMKENQELLEENQKLWQENEELKQQLKKQQQ